MSPEDPTNAATDPAAMPEPKPSSELVRKWGKRVASKFTIVPLLLLREQHRLEISSTQLAVLIHLLSFWWAPEKPQWVAKSTIARNMGITERQLQRQIKELEEKGLVKRIPRKTTHGTRANSHDFSGLIKKLKELAKSPEEASKESYRPSEFGKHRVR